MDAEHFDRFVVTVGQRMPRRSVLGLLGAFGLAGFRSAEAVGACAVNGIRCGRAGDRPCCSGRCVRKRGTHKRFCRRVPGQSICTILSNSCASTNPNIINCDETAGVNRCQCYVTSAGFSFCGRVPDACFACETNTDCEKRGAGSPGARCVACEHCGGLTNNRACVAPCPNPAPV